ncbi:MAG: orotidine 5'-phosphate decarboxylase / HUMPS family protein, partial [Pseudomonadota bacterium]|nr:orotidine 5'-phosphate decarboxylase / HUMPS family protein [Pseudomonadota bacterium]
IAEPDPGEHARHLFRLASDCGLGGFVCSPQEVAALRALRDDALFVTPGVRPAGAARDDQSRVATPAEAMAQGATSLVIGRPITRAADPRAAAAAILAEIDGHG